MRRIFLISCLCIVACSAAEASRAPLGYEEGPGIRAPVTGPHLSLRDVQITKPTVQQALAELELYLALTGDLPWAQQSEQWVAVERAAAYLRELLATW